MYLSQMTSHVVCDEVALCTVALWSPDGCSGHGQALDLVVILFKGYTADQGRVLWIPFH